MSRLSKEIDVITKICHHILETSTSAFYIKIMCLIQTAPRSDKLQGSWNIGIPRMDLDTEKIRETHNLYVIILYSSTMTW